MKEIINIIQGFFAGVGAYLGGILGGIDGFLYALIILIVLDYITGVMASIVENKLASSLGFKGIFKKILIFMLVGIAHIVDSEILDSGGTIRTAVIFFYISNEGISILENTTKIGLPIPQKLKEVLNQLNREEDKDGKL